MRPPAQPARGPLVEGRVVPRAATPAPVAVVAAVRGPGHVHHRAGGAGQQTGLVLAHGADWKLSFFGFRC